MVSPEATVVEQLETKRLAKPFQLEAVDAEGLGKIAGHGAVFDDPHPTSSYALPDDFLDCIRPGAFRRTLADHKSRGIMPAMLLQHDRWSLPIGAWLSCAEDEDGLAVEGQLATKTQRGAEVYELAKVGAITGLSIGFRPVKFKVDEKAKQRDITEVELLEISPVVFPGIDSARISDVKSADPALLKRHIEELLHKGGLSKTEAKALLAIGFDGLLARRDAGADPDARRDADAAVDDVLAGLDPAVMENLTRSWRGA